MAPMSRTRKGQIPLDLGDSMARKWNSVPRCRGPMVVPVLSFKATLPALAQVSTGQGPSSYPSSRIAGPVVLAEQPATPEGRLACG
jgi:hypothetical protein